MFLLILLLSLSLSASNNRPQVTQQVPQPAPLTHAQATDNIKLMIATLLLPQNHSGVYGEELKKFTTDTTKQLLEKQGTKPSFWSRSKVYNYQELYNGVIQEIVVYIDQKSNAYAQEDIHNFFIPSFVKIKDSINTVSEFMHNEVAQVMNQSKLLNDGVLTQYVGAPLRAKIHEALKRELQYAQGQPRPTGFATRECPTCFSEFNEATIKRLYLPCGHNMCETCIKALAQANAQKAQCPLCGYVVSIKI